MRSSRHGSVLGIGLVLMGLACAGCGGGGAGSQLAGLAGAAEPLEATLYDDGLFVASVVFDGGGVPEGATVTLARTTLETPAGLVPAGPAVAVDFSEPPLAGASGTATLRFDPCRFSLRGMTDGDLVLLRDLGGGVETVDADDFTVNADETVTTGIEGPITLLVAVPGTERTRPPIAGLAYHGIALGLEGAVFTWGWNGFGQLANGTTDLGRLPAEVSGGLAEVVSVEAGADFSVALTEEGTALASGANYAGQLGNGTFEGSLLPTYVRRTARFVRIAAGPTSRSVLAEADDGRLFVWGAGNFGQAGRGTLLDEPIASPVPGIAAPRDFAIGDHALAALADGTVAAWGRNDLGQLGDGSFTGSSSPVEVSGLDGIVAVAAGGNFSVALREDGTLWAWGGLNLRVPGSALPRATATPVRIDLGVLSGSGGTPPDRLVAIEATAESIVALDDLCRLWILRTSGPGPLLAAVPVLGGLPGRRIVDLDGGVGAVVVALDDGTFLAIGDNSLGQLGDGTFLPSAEPVVVPGIPD